MTNPSHLPRSKSELPALVTSPPLSYCCERMFFQANRKRSLNVLSAALGVSRWVIYRRRLLFKEKALNCEGCENCMKSRLG